MKYCKACRQSNDNHFRHCCQCGSTIFDGNPPPILPKTFSMPPLPEAQNSKTEIKSVDFKFYCPFCAQHIQVDSECCGSSCACPNCSKEITIPNRNAAIPVVPKATDKYEWKIAAVSLGVFLLICLVVGILRNSKQIAIVNMPDGTSIQVDVSAIKNVIATDKTLGDATRSSQRGMSFDSDDNINLYANTIYNYVTQAKGIDTSRCPRDFAEAYSRHVSAWRNKADTITNHPHIRSGGEAFVEGVLRGLNGDITGGGVQMYDDLNNWKTKVQSSEQYIDQTWAEVEALEVRYGAK